MNQATILANLSSEAAVPDNGIVSRTLHSDDHLKVVLFGFDAGQELSEHTASVPATIHIIEGTADVRVGEQFAEAAPGYWAWLPAHMPHSILAKTKTVMLLYMMKGAR